MGKFEFKGNVFFRGIEQKVSQKTQQLYGVAYFDNGMRSEGVLVDGNQLPMFNGVQPNSNVELTITLNYGKVSILAIHNCLNK